MTALFRGEVWWGEAPDQKGRPYLVLTRNEAISVLRTVVVAPITRTIRDIPSEVHLGRPEGLAIECAANFDNVLAFPKAMLVRRVGALGAQRVDDVCRAMSAAIDC
ncbi:MAG: type II toxin-antitoxin system PemK/MazF family toxin [Acidimicrobiales bacterium]